MASIVSPFAVSRMSCVGLRLFCSFKTPILTSSYGGTSLIPTSSSSSHNRFMTSGMLPAWIVAKTPEFAPFTSFRFLVTPFSAAGAIALTTHIGTSSQDPSISTAHYLSNVQSILGDLSTWLIKRTFQPSIIRKRRKHGFLRRQESVGGRRVLKRRLAKGRMRLGGS